MRANSLKFRGTSGIAVLALALLLASCVKESHKVGGTVSGLTGTGLVLQNNGGDNLAISANGTFTFSKEVKKDARYSVTVFAQPAGQTCTVTNGSGTVKSDVTNVAVNCAGNGFTVGGTVSGLTGTGLVLQNNGGNDLPIAADGSFTFPALLANAATYNVTVRTQPAGQGCSVANGSGTIAGVNVTTVAVTCATAPSAPNVNPIGFGVKELQFGWGAVSGATFYRVLESPDGGPVFNQVATNVTALSFNYTIPVHRRLNALYEVAACNAGGCTASTPQDVQAGLTQAIGYMKASNTQAADNFGVAAALSADGSTLAIGATGEDSGSSGINSVPDESASAAGAVYVFSRASGAWVQQAYVKASNAGSGDTFGIAVSLSDDGNTLAVGAQGESSGSIGINSVPDESASLSGAAYVYTRSGNTWTQQAYVKSSNPDVFDFFGSAVALSGDGNTLAVGAPFESSGLTGVAAGSVSEATAGNAAPFSGAVYVYARNAGSWSQQAYVKASNTETMDIFGNSVALSVDGNTLAVGAPGEDGGLMGVTGGIVSEATAGNASLGSGAVYVFARVAGAWSQQAYVKASNTGDGDQFGTSVSLSGDGDTLATGATGEASGSTGINSTPDESAAGAGAVYVYTRSAGAWSQQAYVKASNAGDSDNFGTSVALSRDGNALAVGAPREDGSGTGIEPGTDEAAADSGAVYFYTRSAGVWAQQTYVKASNAQGDDRFGTSVALSGDGNALAVGAMKEDGDSTGVDGPQGNNNAPQSGAAYLY